VAGIIHLLGKSRGKILVNAKLLCAVWLALLIGRAAANENAIVGEWAGDIRTKGGLGSSLVFAADGELTSRFGALVDFKYSVEGQTYKMTFADNSEALTEQFEIVGDKFISKPSNPKIIGVGDKLNSKPPSPRINGERTRVGTAIPGAPPIVGVWSFHSSFTPDAAPDRPLASVRYTKDGRGQLSIPFIAPRGHYTIQGQELTMEFKGKPSFKRKILLAGDHLTLLAGGTDSEQKFTRAPAITGTPASAAPMSAASTSAEYNAFEAAKHVGERGTVIDKVEDVHQTNAGTIFINMGGAYPNHAFTAFIAAEDASDFKSVKAYKGATISVTGKIGLYKDKPQIVVTDPSQLTVKTPAESPSPP
jgi:hypothetical protein